MTATPTSTAASVSITYAAPTADLNTQMISFAGTQPQGVASAAQTLTVTNNGSAPLADPTLTLGGTDPNDYLLTNGCQADVAAGSNCQIGVRFAPQATGASSATLTLTDNALTAPAAVSLSGTGGTLPQGAAGPVGPAGPLGAIGPTGATGATGSTGAEGGVELVTCKTAVKTVKGKKQTTKRCTAKRVRGTVHFTTQGTLMAASLSRGSVVYATGKARRTAKTTTLLLRPQRRLTAGRYTLKLGASLRDTVLLR